MKQALQSGKRRAVTVALAALLATALVEGVRTPVTVVGQTAVGNAIKVGAAQGPPAWQHDLTPISREEWSYARAAHLLERAGFGGTPEEIARLAKLTPEKAVGLLVDYETNADKLSPFEESGIFDEAMLADVDKRYDDFGAGVRAGYAGKAVYGVKANSGGVRRLQPVIDQLYYRGYANDYEWTRATIWWANRMLATKRPLEEKLVFFWHGHFATEDAKVRDYRLMLNQLALLRANASGNFRNLLLGISKDPAMLVYLDNRKNVKGQANENYAREIMELFALGVGNYTEQDIKEAGRAFTGWDNLGPKFISRPEIHDDGVKTILGETGKFTGEEVVDIILRQRACAEFMSRKLYRFLVRETLAPELNAQLAAKLRASKYELKPLLKTIFLSRDFYSPASYATQIKSPVQLVVSTYRKLGLTEVPGTPYFPQVSSGLGQVLGNPPNVKGWDGGRAWINPSTLLQRANFARHILFPELAAGEYPGRQVPPRYRNAREEAEERDRLAAQGRANTESGGAMALAAGEMMSASVKINSVPDYDLKLGVRNGYVKAFERVKETPRIPASFSLTAMAKGVGVKTAEEAADYFVLRLLRLPLTADDRAALVEYLKKQWGGAPINYSAPSLEQSLRELVHLIMSTPEYQIS